MGVELFGISSELYGSGLFWSICVIVPALALSRDIAWKYYKRHYGYDSYHIIQEMQTNGQSGVRQNGERIQNIVKKVKHIQIKKRSGYAFSQSGGQSDMIKAYEQRTQ
eukprot:NODE_509_length_6670_cov_0.463856.p4 type:complete len:108 gc:universal NODE_509_length_6670_cov_0.463856:485-162(-)